jgi:hypothetical protein
MHFDYELKAVAAAAVGGERGRGGRKKNYGRENIAMKMWQSTFYLWNFNLLSLLFCFWCAQKKGEKLKAFSKRRVISVAKRKVISSFTPCSGFSTRSLHIGQENFEEKLIKKIFSSSTQQVQLNKLNLKSFHLKICQL